MGRQMRWVGKNPPVWALKPVPGQNGYRMGWPIDGVRVPACLTGLMGHPFYMEICIIFRWILSSFRELRWTLPIHGNSFAETSISACHKHLDDIAGTCQWLICDQIPINRSQTLVWSYIRVLKILSDNLDVLVSSQFIFRLLIIYQT
jgi:hypothetical protein